MPSSVIASMKYDRPSRTLRIIFRSGRVYDYFGVPLNVYRNMRKADSKGRYLNKHIKGTYEFGMVH